MWVNGVGDEVEVAADSVVRESCKSATPNPEPKRGRKNEELTE